MMLEKATTVVEALERAASYPEAGLRLVDGREKEEWRAWVEIRRRALEVSGSLAALGVVSGDRIVLIFPTSWGFFEAFFGVLVAGAVPVPLYPPVRLGRIGEYHRATARMVVASGAELVLADGRVKRLLGETIRRASLRLGCRTLEEILPGPGQREVRPRLDDLALVQFSSGTTANPKPVALSHRAVMSQALSLNSFWPDDEQTTHKGLSWLPLYHDMGLIGCVFPALERPTELTLIPPEQFVSRPAIWLRAISRYGATISPAPNFAYGLCVQKIRNEEMDGVDLSSWQVALNGAETASPRVMHEFQRRFSRWGLRRQALTPVYGLSEAALAVTFSELGREFRACRVRSDQLGMGDLAEESVDGTEIASVGRPLPGFEVELRRSDGSLSAEREVGRIWTRGPSLMQGYLGREDETARVLKNGWLDTGDLGFRIDEELHIAGRHKDLVIVRGRNYAPEHLEGTVDRLPGVRRGCVVAVSTPIDSVATERVLLFVEKDGAAAASEIGTLAERCRAQMSAVTGLVPDRVILLAPGTLPRTSSGKMRRSETLSRYLAGDLRLPERVGWWLMLRELLRSRLAFRSAKR